MLLDRIKEIRRGIFASDYISFNHDNSNNDDMIILIIIIIVIIIMIILNLLLIIFIISDITSREGFYLLNSLSEFLFFLVGPKFLFDPFSDAIREIMLLQCVSCPDVEMGNVRLSSGK